MPIKIMTPELRRRQASRVLLYGAPNSWKTTSVVATAAYPLHIISMPGEQGWGTIPDNVPGLSSYVWEEPGSDPVSAESIRREVEDTVFGIIAGKHGPVQTLCLDGLHQLYTVYLNVATSGAFGRGDEFEAKVYTRSHSMFQQFLRRVLSSEVPYIICTTWNAKEADTEGGKVGHQWPDLPGQLAKRVVGMFSVVVYARVIQPASPMAKPRGEWLLKPDSEVWGASVKMDPRLIAKLPTAIPQSFKELYKVVGAAEAEIEQESTSENSAGVSKAIA